MTRKQDRGHSPTLRARRLALELTERREACGLSRDEVTRRLEWANSTLFRIETGRSKPQPRSVRELLDLYGVTGPEKEGLIQLAREARQPGWWHSFRDVLPNPYEVFIGLEAGATTIRAFEPLTVPGLLQTADYSRAMIRGGPHELDPDEIDRRAQVRSARQEILSRPDRPHLWVVLDEAALHRTVGSKAIMRRQLAHLIEMAQRDKTTLQVLPFEVGAHAASTTGPFVILGFAEPTDPDVVYLETIPDGVYLENASDVQGFMLAFDRLLDAALRPDDSIALIRRVADASA
ncbi:helix-turn-helix transcriptional regulator [Actinomadura viridis]|uniref:Transcriptional regulator with XRE-family HTH domain n=1 Tax=Actinomadura viridis TaxID=58110 RepID=A0A931DPP4_9ACTN|nr:helix-turn-helix transcriptional regulator [Actinomadura viridis]MBG6093532.1 transcriptional regulator with XRE-family HTH domain [Actinomadura viridis]